MAQTIDMLLTQRSEKRVWRRERDVQDRLEGPRTVGVRGRYDSDEAREVVPVSTREVLKLKLLESAQSVQRAIRSSAKLQPG